MSYFLVGIGGMMGSITRYKLGKIINHKYKSNFPIATFFINISGAILLGMLSAYNIDKSVYLIFGDGFLGAYTTFSTFMYEGFNLFEKKKYLNFYCYILLSIIIGVLGFMIGNFVVTKYML